MLVVTSAAVLAVASADVAARMLGTRSDDPKAASLADNWVGSMVGALARKTAERLDRGMVEERAPTSVRTKVAKMVVLSALGSDSGLVALWDQSLVGLLVEESAA